MCIYPLSPDLGPSQRVHLRRACTYGECIYGGISVYLFLIIITIALVLARVYLKQESAAAYQMIFQEIIDIAEKDVGTAVKFQHMDGAGIGCFIADAHKGQALGIYLS